jgi:hypothetical protein
MMDWPEAAVKIVETIAVMVVIIAILWIWKKD